MSGLQVQVEHRQGMAFVHIDGYLSSESSGPLQDAFGALGETGKILLVFAEKSFLNSAGLAVLFDLVLPWKEQGRQVRLVHPAKHFRKVFDIMGLSKDVEVYAAEEEALAGW